MHGSISYLHWDAAFIPFLIILAFLGDRDDDTSHTPLKQEVFTDQTLIPPKPFRRVKRAWKRISKIYACRKCITA
jgi:cytochrome P450